MRPKTQILMFAGTSGFRMALRSLTLSLAGAALVFAVIHHAAETAWHAQIDGTVSSALSDIQADVKNNKKSLTQKVRKILSEGSPLFYAVLGPDGNWIEGNIRTSQPIVSWTSFKTFHRHDGFVLPEQVKAIRGTIYRFPGGESLIIAADATALLALDRLIARSFLAVFGTIMMIGLINGYLAARTALKRVDIFARTIQDIINGDLSRRFDIGNAGDEFDRLAASTNKMLQRIQELMDNIRQVTNDISHDLRSPLARLREHLEVSRNRSRGQDSEASFDVALAQIDQVLEIFSALLRIAEIEAGACQACFEPVLFSSLLTTIAEIYEPLFAESGIAIEIDLNPPLTIYGDRELLAQLVTNLLDNVSQHASDASLVTIHAAETAGQFNLSVSDNGCGIPRDQHQQVMKRFMRLDKSRHLPGYGLGLSLVSAIVDLHGGCLTLEDNLPGLIVSIKFPARIAALPQ